MTSINALRSEGVRPLLLAAGSAIAVLAFHPHVGSHGAEESLRLLANKDLMAKAAYVHAGLLGVLAVLSYGMLALARALGASRAPVACGVLAWVLGSAAMTGAMLLDGFVTPQLAARLLHTLETGGRALAFLEAAPVAFALLTVMIQVSTKAGFCAMGAGMAALSWAGRGQAPWFGCLGLFAGALPAFAYAASGISLGQHQLMLLVGCQGLWYAGAATWIARGGGSRLKG